MIEPAVEMAGAAWGLCVAAREGKAGLPVMIEVGVLEGGRPSLGAVARGAVDIQRNIAMGTQGGVLGRSLCCKPEETSQEKE